MKETQDTLVSIPLDQLRAFDLNPRIVRNPHYDEIKASVRSRGLEHPLVITQRPGEPFYIIASGGNTRLAILHELWRETQDKKYRTVTCYFRPWQNGKSAKEGDLGCLLGHLVENEMRGSLTFIEKALAIQNAANIYQSLNKRYSQKEIIQMLAQQGYIISPAQMSTMFAAIQLLLPYIPELLYSGLSKTSIDQLLSLRSGTKKFWDNFSEQLPYATEHKLPLFDDIFAAVLASFDGSPGGFSLKHIQDELTGQVSLALNTDYNTVALVTDARAQKRRIMLGEAAPALPEISEQRSVALKYQEKKHAPTDQQKNRPDTVADDPAGSTTDSNGQTQRHYATASEDPHSCEETAAVPAPQAFLSSALISDEPSLHTREALAAVIDHTAWELAASAGVEFLISPAQDGLFTVADSDSGLSAEGKIYHSLLAFLAGQTDNSALIWRQMFIGTPDTPAGFNAQTLTKIVQLVFAIRRLYETQQRGKSS